MSKYDEYIINNKNFNAIFNSQQEKKFAKTMINAGKSVIGMVGGAILDNPAVMGQGISTLSNVGNMIADLYYDKEIFDYSVDNIKNAPPNIANISGNIYLNDYYNSLNCYMYEEEIIKCEMNQIEYYFRKYGYSLSKFAQIKSTEIQPRKYFNYVKANIDNVFIDKKDMWNNTITYPYVPFLSNELINDIKRIFKNGIAIWKVSTSISTLDGVEFDYTINNYEERFDNE